MKKLDRLDKRVFTYIDKEVGEDPSKHEVNMFLVLLINMPQFEF